MFKRFKEHGRVALIVVQVTLVVSLAAGLFASQSVEAPAVKKVAAAQQLQPKHGGAGEPAHHR